MRKELYSQILSRVNKLLGRTDSASAKVSYSEAEKLQMSDQFGKKGTAAFIAASEAFATGNDDDGGAAIDSFLAESAVFNTDAVAAVNRELALEREQRIALENKYVEMSDKYVALEEQVAKLSGTGEGDPPIERRVINGTTKMPQKWSIDRNHSHVQGVEDMRATNHYAGDTIDIDDVQAEFDNLSDLGKIPVLNEVLCTFMTSNYLTWKYSEKDTYKATQGIVTEILQPFSAEFTPKGKGVFTPIEIPLRHVGIDAKITPADVRDWITQMYREDVDITMMPITRWFMERMMVKIKDDLERISGRGVYVEHDESGVVEGDPGLPASDILDGYITYLEKQNALGTSNINFLLEGLEALTPENIVDKVHEFVDGIDEKYAGVKMPIICSYNTYKMYKRAYKERFGSDSGNPEFGQDQIDYSVNRLVWLFSANGFGGLIATPKENFIGLRHINEPTNTRFDTQKHGRNVWVIGEFRYGIGYQIQEAIFAYIPDAGSGSGGLESA